MKLEAKSRLIQSAQANISSCPGYKEVMDVMRESFPVAEFENPYNENGVAGMTFQGTDPAVSQQFDATVHELTTRFQAKKEGSGVTWRMGNTKWCLTSDGSTVTLSAD